MAEQLHKRFSTKEVKALLKGDCFASLAMTKRDPELSHIGVKKFCFNFESGESCSQNAHFWAVIPKKMAEK